MENPNDLTLSTPYGSLQLFALSNNAFKEWVARAARTTLMLQQKIRQEFGPVPANHMVDINLTRFLLDSKFRSDDEFAFLQPHLKNLPPNWKYSTNLLRMAQCGRVFTTPRLRAANLASSDTCIACDQRETAWHLFCEYPFYKDFRPDDVPGSLDSLWLSGICFFPSSLFGCFSFTMPGISSGSFPCSRDSFCRWFLLLQQMAFSLFCSCSLYCDYRIKPEFCPPRLWCV